MFDGQAVWSMDGVTVSHDTIVEDGRTVAALSDFVVRVRHSEDVSVGQYKVTMMSVLGTAIAFGIVAGLLLIAH